MNFVVIVVVVVVVIDNNLFGPELFGARKELHQQNDVINQLRPIHVEHMKCSFSITEARGSVQDSWNIIQIIFFLRVTFIDNIKL